MENVGWGVGLYMENVGWDIGMYIEDVLSEIELKVKTVCSDVVLHMEEGRAIFGCLIFRSPDAVLKKVVG